MNATHRSIDQIGFYTISEARARRTACLHHENDPLIFPIERTEVVLDGTCNLKCSFCKGLPENESYSFALEEYCRVTGEWSAGSPRYVHLTGGEPTLWKELGRAVRASTQRNTTTCMTSNGLAGNNLYQRLVSDGLRDVRISLHAHTAGLYGKITGVEGAFKKVVDTIESLVNLRDTDFPELYVMINATIYEENIRDFVEIVKFLTGLRPNDIKPIVTVQWTGESLAEERRRYETETLPHLLEAVREWHFPILHYRLPSLLTQRLRGYHGENGPDPSRCYLMLDDRCVDAQYYYPCNIYLREGGEPLGSHLKDNREAAAMRIWSWVHEHDIRQDPICRSCCPDVVRAYNTFTGQLVSGQNPAEPAQRLVC